MINIFPALHSIFILENCIWRILTRWGDRQGNGKRKPLSLFTVISLTAIKTKIQFYTPRNHLLPFLPLQGLKSFIRPTTAAWNRTYSRFHDSFTTYVRRHHLIIASTVSISSPGTCWTTSFFFIGFRKWLWWTLGINYCTSHLPPIDETLGQGHPKAV